LGLRRTWKWRKLHNKELYELYCSPNIVRVIKQNGKVGARSTYGEAERGVPGFGGGGGLRERDHLKDPGVDGRIILIYPIY